MSSAATPDHALWRKVTKTEVEGLVPNENGGVSRDNDRCEVTKVQRNRRIKCVCGESFGAKRTALRHLHAVTGADE